MATYSLLTSEATVHVLSPTFSVPVEYCTILTSPSGTIASMPVNRDVFDAGGGGIEQIVALPNVSSAVGVQTLDNNNLIADNVSFTVRYTPPGSPATDITAEALIRVAELNFADAEIGRVLLADVEAKIAAAYANLQALAGG
jgi:hypothetical protein